MKVKNHGNGLPFEILKWALLIYTGYRSLDILKSTMPDGNMLFAIPALLGLDVGVLVWSYLYEKRAEGNQATLAALLTVADLVGVGLCLIADSLMYSAQADAYKPFVDTIAIFVGRHHHLSKRGRRHSLPDDVTPGRTRPQRKGDERVL